LFSPAILPDFSQTIAPATSSTWKTFSFHKQMRWQQRRLVKNNNSQSSATSLYNYDMMFLCFFSKKILIVLSHGDLH